MNPRTTMAWLLILTLALLLFCSCESGGNYRNVDYHFGTDVGWAGYSGGPAWRYHPGYPSYPGRPAEIDLPDNAEPFALPLPSMGMPEFGEGDPGGFE